MLYTHQANHEPRHTAQEQLGPVQVRINLSNSLKLDTFLRLFGRPFHTLAASNLKDFLPYVVVLTEGTRRVFSVTQRKCGLFNIYKVSDVRRGNIVYAFKSFQINCPKSAKMESR